MEAKTGYALVAQERAQTLLVRLALAAFLAALGVAIFVWGLGLPIPLFGR